MAWEGREYTDTKMWSSTESDLYDFLVRYNRMLENRGPVSCLKCDEELTEHKPTIDLDNHLNLNIFFSVYGTQKNVCHQCSNYVCLSCPTEVDNFCHYWCSTCEREYCTKCVTMEGCRLCEDMFCVDSCLPHSCSYCDEKLCGECKVSATCIKCNRICCAGDDCFRNCPTCECCNKTCCVECSKEDKANEMFYCDCRYGTACLIVWSILFKKEKLIANYASKE